MPDEAPVRRSCAVHPRGGDSRSECRAQRSMAAGSSSPWSPSHTVRVEYWNVSTAVAGAPQPGRAQRGVRNIRATYPPTAGAARMPVPGLAPVPQPSRRRYTAVAAYHGFR